MAGGSSLTFNEATYVELSHHPWYSSYYPDTLFVRHPPLAFLLLGGWLALFGSGEAPLRLLSLVASLGGLVLIWHGARKVGGEAAGSVAALAVGASFALHAYALQATMYPFAFTAAAAAAWARVHRRDRLEALSLAAFALTHLFGFLFLALWTWRERERWRWCLARSWPAWAWIGLSIPLAMALNGEGDIMRLGGLGQAIRTVGTAGDAVAVRPLVHLASGALAILALNPLLLGALGLNWRSWKDWAVGLAILVPFFFLSSPYPRYALLPLPFVAVAGAPAVVAASRRLIASSWQGVRRTLPAACVALSVLTLPVGFAYLHDGPDPRAAGDVPGEQDWRGAVNLLAESAQPSRLASSGPTATSYYLSQLGWHVANRTDAPYHIGLAGPRELSVLCLDQPSDIATTTAQAWLVPDHWQGATDSIAQQGGRECGRVAGLVVFATAC